MNSNLPSPPASLPSQMPQNQSELPEAVHGSKKNIVIVISSISALVVITLIGVITVSRSRVHDQPIAATPTLTESAPSEAGESAVISLAPSKDPQPYLDAKALGDASITYDQQYRYITATGLPDHQTGQFPNAQNPNQIADQNYSFRMPLLPSPAPQVITFNVEYEFGVALNGVPFDPAAAEWYRNDPQSGWQREAMGSLLGLDFNNAHVQPDGAYHYHGLPTSLLSQQDDQTHSQIIGFAADGYPIYARYGFSIPGDATSSVKELTSSYQLKSGVRASGPGGEYDGTYIQDYVYIPSHGDLDQCNGRTTITPEYPRGTYAYFLTNDFPYVPRCFKGVPDDSFRKLPNTRPLGAQGLPSDSQLRH